jgi:hypothetical protein
MGAPRAGLGRVGRGRDVVIHMDDNERKAIIAESRATVERLSGLKVTPPRDPLHEDALERWARQRPQPEPPRRQREPNAAEVEIMRAGQWQRYIDSRVRVILAEHDKIRIEATGTALGMLRKQLREEFTAAISSLRGELAAQRAQGDDHAVVELPNPIRKVRHAA